MDVNKAAGSFEVNTKNFSDGPILRVVDVYVNEEITIELSDKSMAKIKVEQIREIRESVFNTLTSSFCEGTGA